MGVGGVGGGVCVWRWGRSSVIVKCAKRHGPAVCTSQEFSLNISKRHDGKQRENGYQNLEQWSQMR